MPKKFNSGFNLENLIMTGVDYKNCPVEIREKLAFTHSNLENAYEQIKQAGKTSELVILSTCNRSELYAVSGNPVEGIKYLKQFYADFFNVTDQEIDEYIIVRTHKEVVKHIFEVAMGFQSMVLGEDQILGQVKDSYDKALKAKSTGKILNRLFIESITSAKKIKVMTGISENSVSVGSIGIKLIEQKLNCLSNKNVLVIGLGKMSKIAVKNIIKKGIHTLYVTNRTRRKVTDFAKEFPQVIQIDFKDRYSVIDDVDVIISCTSAPHYVISEKKFLEAYKSRPLYMLDLAIPRDIEPTINNIAGVELYRIDDLEKIAQDNIEKRLKTKQQAEKILVEDMNKFVDWTHEAIVADAIISIQKSSKEIIEEQLNKLREQLCNIDEEQLEIIENTFCNLSRLLSHEPTAKIKEFAREYQKCSCHSITLCD